MWSQSLQIELFHFRWVSQVRSFAGTAWHPWAPKGTQGRPSYSNLLAEISGSDICVLYIYIHINTYITYVALVGEMLRCWFYQFLLNASRWCPLTMMRRWSRTCRQSNVYKGPKSSDKKTQIQNNSKAFLSNQSTFVKTCFFNPACVQWCMMLTWWLKVEHLALGVLYSRRTTGRRALWPSNWLTSRSLVATWHVYFGKGGVPSAEFGMGNWMKLVNTWCVSVLNSFEQHAAWVAKRPITGGLRMVHGHVCALHLYK